MLFRSRATFDYYVISEFGEFADYIGDESHSFLTRFDLFRDTDAHVANLLNVR